jgi:hypothetical protein
MGTHVIRLKEGDTATSIASLSAADLKEAENETDTKEKPAGEKAVDPPLQQSW